LATEPVSPILRSGSAESTSPHLPDLVHTPDRKINRTQSERSGDLTAYLANKTLLRPGSPLSPPIQHSHSFSFPEVKQAELKVAMEQKRREAVWDLFQSESAFLRHHLMALKNVFLEPLKKVQVEGFVMCAEPEVLFGNLDELCCVTYAFCKEFINLLTELVAPDGDLPVLEILTVLFHQSTKAMSVSKAFHRYALNYINALNYLETLRRQPEFAEFEKWCNKDPRCKKLQLTDLLVSPVHHIMKMPLVLKEIEAKSEDAQEKLSIGKMLHMKESSLRELDDKMKWLKNFERLLEIQRNVVWPGVMELEPKQYFPEFLKSALAKQPCERLIVSPRRQILMEGPLSLVDSGKPTEMFIILFDDMLLITRRKKALSKKKSFCESLTSSSRKSSISDSWPSPCSTVKNSDVALKYIVYKQPLSLDRFFIHDVTATEGNIAKLENAFIIISLNRFQQIIGVHTFLAQSEAVKTSWLQKLSEAQERWKSTLHQTVFREPLSSVGPK